MKQTTQLKVIDIGFFLRYFAHNNAKAAKAATVDEAQAFSRFGSP